MKSRKLSVVKSKLEPSVFSQQKHDMKRVRQLLGHQERGCVFSIQTEWVFFRQYLYAEKGITITADCIRIDIKGPIVSWRNE